MKYFEWTNQKKLSLDAFSPSQRVQCLLCLPLQHASPCCLAGAVPGSSAIAGTRAQPPPPQEHAAGLVQLLSQFFFSWSWIGGLGKDRLEQHVLSLSVFNGRMVCPGQLMGTRTCRGVRPPHSAAAMDSEPAGALRSRVAPCQPGSRGQL